MKTQITRSLTPVVLTSLSSAQTSSKPRFQLNCLAACILVAFMAPLSVVGQAPTISVNGVQNAASFLPGLSSGSFLTISGTNLSTTTRIWKDSDFNGKKLPLALDGVSVKINGKSAAVYFISPRQINALAPADTAVGTVQVTVTNASGTSAPASAALQTYAPAFFHFDQQNRAYAAAVFPEGTYVAKDGLFGSTTRSVPAAPGNVIVLYGTGFGPTSPAVPADEILSAAVPLTNPRDLTIRIGGVPAIVQFAGLSGTGLYQFNVQVPEVPDGDQTIVAQIGGISSEASLLLTIKRPPPLPQISNVAPNDLVWGQNASLTFSGTNLTGVNKVEIAPPDGITVTGYGTPSATSMSVSVTVGASAPTGDRSVVAIGPSGRSNAVTFNVRPGNPQITSVVPATLYPDRIYWNPFCRDCPQGSFNITGTDLAGVQTVEFSPPDGLRLPPPTVSTTTAGGILTTGPDAQPGTRSVRVISPGGTSNSLTFQVQNPPTGTPVISAVSVSASNSGRNGSYSGKLSFTDSDGDISTRTDGPTAKLLLRPVIANFFALLSCSYSPVTGTYLNLPGQTSGTIEFSFSQSVSYSFSGNFPIYVSLIDAAGHESNTVTVFVTSWVC